MQSSSEDWPVSREAICEIRTRLFIHCCACVVMGIQTCHCCFCTVSDIPHRCPFYVQHCCACCGQLILPLGGNCPWGQSDSRRASFSKCVHKSTTCPSFCASKYSQPAQSGQTSRDKCFGMDPIFFWSIPLKGKYFWILVVPGYQCTHYTAMSLAKALIILMPFSPAGCPRIRLSEHQQWLHPFTPRPPSFGMYSSEFENLCLLGNSGFQGCSWFHIFYWAVKATRHWYIGT